MGCEFFTSTASNAVGTLTADYLVKPIERPLRYLFRFHKIVEDLHQKQNDLKRERTRVKEDIKEAKSQNQVIEDYVDEWLASAENNLNDADSLNCRVGENKRCFRWCPNWSWRYRLSKEMEKKAINMSKLVEGSRFERIGHPAELPMLDLVATKDHVDFKSSKAALNKIMEALKDDLVKKIGVWGMGGVGKTTVVTKIGGEVKGFDRVIMVAVSATPDIEKIQQKIADFINLNFEKKSEEGKAAELWNRLNGGKFLIILDDLWNEWNDDDDLRKIGIPLVENGKGCKIILTTRRRTVCESMECQVTTPIDVLDSNEAWDLFRLKSDFDETVPRDIIEEAKKVAKECKGLPVAIVTLASALKGAKTRKDWQVALRKLENSKLIEIGSIGEKDEDKNAYWCIKMSYEYLKKNTTKKCFLLCALYPEDHSIHVEDLVRYASALELYGKDNSIGEVRTQVLQTIGYLKDSCLLLEDEDKNGDVGRYVKLHDIVRDVALWIASKQENGFMMKTRLELLNENSESCKAISLLNNEENEFPKRLVHSKLEILLLKNCNVQGTCFYEMKELKVLSLSMPYDSPKLISLYALISLRKLRALQLENFEDLKFLGNLKTLEILSLAGSGFEDLADELGRLKNLKILDLTGCTFSSKFPSNVIRKLFKLEELYLKGSNIGDEEAILLDTNFLSRLTVLSLEVSNFHFREDFELPKLDRYNIVIRSADESCSIYLTENSWKIEGTIPLTVFTLLPESLESLEMSDSIDEFVECLTGTNLKLSKLKFLELTNLSCLCELPTKHVRLEGLVDLRIENCPSLKSLFSHSAAQSLLLLENLEISYCHGLKQIVTELEGDEEEISSTINSDHYSLCFPKLKKLGVKNCDGLEYIFPTLMAPQGLQGLSLTMWNCPQLKQVIRLAKDGTKDDMVLQQLLLLRSLLEFAVIGCPQLTDSAVRLDAEEASLEEVRLSAFKESFNTSKQLRLYEAIEDRNLVPAVKRDGFNGLTSLDLKLCKDLECLVDTTTGNGPTSCAFSNLERLSIENMDGLESLCKGQPPQGFLNNLKQLYVWRCEKLQMLFQMDEYRQEIHDQPLISNLQSLHLYKLPELRWILKGSSHSFSLRSLKVVKINDCSKLEFLFSPSLIQCLALLEKLEIQKCDELKTLFAEPETDSEVGSKSSSSPLCLPKLKILHISWCSKLEYVFPITLAQGLTALASVTIYRGDGLKQVFGMAKDHDTGVVLLPSLQHLRFSRLKKLSRFVPKNYIVKAPALKSLKADGCSEFSSFPIQQEVNKQLKLAVTTVFIFKELSCITKHLSLSKVGDHKKLVPEVVDLEHLNGLTSLKIMHWQNFKCLLDTSQEMIKREEDQAPPMSMLSNLEYLKLKSLPELRWIVKGPTHWLNLQCLKLLEVKRCYRLESVFSVSVVQTLRSLDELKISRCDELKSVFMELESDNESNALGSFPNLKTLEITKCPNLEYVFPLALAPSFRCLQKLTLHHLRSLKSLVAGNIFLEAPALEVLDIQECPAFTYFTLQKQLNNGSTLKELTFSMREMVGTSQLRQTSPKIECLTLGNFEQLFQLQGGYFISSLQKMMLGNLIWLRDIWNGSIHVATNLRELEVCNCNNLTYVFPLMHIPYLPQLSILSIKRCHNLKNIIGSDGILASSSQGPQQEKNMVFPQLKEVVLENLPRLESFSPVGYHLKFPRLELLDFKKCSKVITSFSVDYLTLTVHAKTSQASHRDDTSPSQDDISWKRRRFTLLPPYVEDAQQISPLK